MRLSSEPSRIACASAASSDTPSIRRRSACARACSGPSSSSRSSCAITFVATRARKLSRPSTAGMTPRSRNSRTASASSPLVGTARATSLARQARLEEEEHVVLLLPHPAADGRQLDGALLPRQVPPRLPHAGAAPPHRAEDLPPAHHVWIHPAAAHPLVSAEQVLVGPES